MKLLVIFALVVVAAAAPAPQETAQVKILKDERSMEGDGKFSYAWESEDGSMADATGENKMIGEAFGVAMSGSYSFQAPDGKTYEVTWTADENGFQPVVTQPENKTGYDSEPSPPRLSAHPITDGSAILERDPPSYYAIWWPVWSGRRSVLQELLQLQYGGVSVMDMFGRVRINVNLIIFLRQQGPKGGKRGGNRTGTSAAIYGLEAADVGVAYSGEGRDESRGEKIGGSWCLTAVRGDVTSEQAAVLGSLLSTSGDVKQLLLNDCLLSEDSLKALCLGLCLNTSVTQLELRGNNVRGPGTEHLAILLRKNRHLQSLTLEWNNLGLSPASFKLFAEALRTNKSLKSLDLRSNQLDHQCAAHLARAVAGNRRLRHLGE
ncbi:Leucine-rich repeat-containing protein 45 [Amphibalanus amphitrite]|uniref:Leucine-rich repeat-containing protein 45 n=1 Tax=Amphibalanus amphitrite TaxID=1232801 RepID=A0A6A4X9R5_AMPAM|nr:Leucine-rich repeat-containing protein 45 [Amphibalanus amphitrite]